MKERDEALKKIPTNLESMVNSIQKTAKEQSEKMQEIRFSMESKADKKQMKIDMADKLDCNLFYRAFPHGQAPIDFMKGLIKEQTDEITQRVFEMVKHWDIKLVTLRKDLNIQGVY